MNTLLGSLLPRINQHFILTNTDGTHMSRRDISEYLGLSYSHACRLLREALDDRAFAEFKMGPHVKFIANPYAVHENPEPAPILTAVFKGRCA
ncbi:hypothetical protein [Paenibacillus sp. FSL K6-2859]|uniref:hypothetical protein n=1 Tax=Paenibacillus sp. FSL K6-2859 TaxID=2921482 RepID=UPI0030F96FED